MGTHGFEKWGMSCIHLCSSRLKPFLQQLPGCALAANLLFLEEDQSSAGQVSSVGSSQVQSSKLKAKLWNLNTAGYKACDA